VTQWATPDDPDLRRRKAAEVLVWKQVPVEQVALLAVVNDEAKARVEKLVRARGVTLPVTTAPEFYYV
jgi:hypothetical protein